jgi:CHAT domain-containing protein
MGPIEGVLPEGPLTLIPTGGMASIPFQALHDGLSYLIERREVSMAPTDPGTSSAAGKFEATKTLVVGVPDAAAPEISAEAKQVAEVSGGQVLLGKAASAETVRQACPGQQVIHLACHSVFRPENPWLSAIQLGDGWLGATEIARLDLDGALVVMASCSSGQQGNAGEDELLGLPRALLSAGATAIVMNLWPVDDSVSVGLMSHFHSLLATQPPRAALRSAQLAALDLYPHPYLWAPAVLYSTATAESTEST